MASVRAGGKLMRELYAQEPFDGYGDDDEILRQITSASFDAIPILRSFAVGYYITAARQHAGRPMFFRYLASVLSSEPDRGDEHKVLANSKIWTMKSLSMTQKL